MSRSKIFFFFAFLLPLLCFGENGKEPKSKEAPPQAPERVEVKPTTRDEEIQKRLQDILYATGWFISPRVEVREGVAFLFGRTETTEFKTWAGNLARNTQDVAAVVNKMEVIGAPIWDFSLVLSSLQAQWRRFVGSFPSILIGLIILVVAYLLARLAMAISRAALEKKMQHSLLQEVISRTIGFVIFLFGVYIIFEIADLTNAAFTVIGGTGILGIILGIAFRDITENFLASILLSIQHPFRNGDLIRIEGIEGYVQSLTTRVTLLMSLEGNHVQIPNAIVYKSIIRNFTSNPNRREEFVIGIGLNDAISKAQEIALKVLAEHEAVLKDPEPLVLVDGLGKSSINLRVYFWLDGSRHSSIKVKSSVIRLIKRAFDKEKISIPDEAREVIFPQGIAVHTIKEQISPPAVRKEEKAITATNAESNLKSDAKDLQEQAQQSRAPELGKNLLEGNGKPPPPEKK